MKYHYPKIVGDTRRLGVFNCSCYVAKMNRALTATVNGIVKPIFQYLTLSQPSVHLYIYDNIKERETHILTTF